MLDLDKKVSRDSIFLARDNQMDGFFSRIVRKVKKVVNKVPLVKAYKKTSLHKAFSKFESKHRKKLKILGGVALIATGAHFFGPKLLTGVKGLGGKALASGAAKSVTKSLVTTAIKKKLSDKAQKSLAKKAKAMTATQVLQDPEIIKLSQEIAVAEALKNERAANRAAAEILVREGNVEVTHQVDKISTPKHIEMFTKIGIPAGFALLALLL